MDAHARANRVLRTWSAGERCIAVTEIVYVRPAEPLGLGVVPAPVLSSRVDQGTCGTVYEVHVDGNLIVCWDEFYDFVTRRHVRVEDRFWLTMRDCVDPWSDP
jgi:hypothetical protein